MSKALDLVVIGGGAAGFFAAINYAEKHPNKQVTILEASNKFLQKVKVSGGGRCNVTHFCFEPKELTAYYPRGTKELLGPFHYFQPGDTIAWFAERGVDLVPEEDGRMFPSANTSEAIIALFMERVNALGIRLLPQTKVEKLVQGEEGWELDCGQNGSFVAKNTLLATGGTTSFYQVLERVGVNMISPSPSLFSFHFKDRNWMEGLAGNTLQEIGVAVDLKGFKMEEFGPVVFTHKGMSGPGVLKLSAWGASHFKALNYSFPISLNFIPSTSLEQFESHFAHLQGESILKFGQFDIPKRTWEALMVKTGFDQVKASEIRGKTAKAMYDSLSKFAVQVEGKSANKEEFVTAGGIDLKEVNFKTMELKRFPGLFAAGELLNIDGLTGGFNFQAAWTGAFIAAENMH